MHEGGMEGGMERMKWMLGGGRDRGRRASRLVAQPRIIPLIAMESITRKWCVGIREREVQGWREGREGGGGDGGREGRSVMIG